MVRPNKSMVAHNGRGRRESVLNKGGNWIRVLTNCYRKELARLRRKLPKAVASSVAKPWRHRKQVILRRAIAKKHICTKVHQQCLGNLY